MYAKQYSTVSNIIPLSIPAEPRPGEHITYTRGGRILAGYVMGSITTEVQRHKIDGAHPVVVEYIVEVDAGYGQPWKYHTVYVGDVVWSKVQ